MMTHFWRKIVVGLGYCGAGLVILAALLVSVTRLLMPLLNDHLTDFEKLAERVLNRPVHIGMVEIAWDFYEPELFFHDVILLDQQTQKPSVEIPFIKINFAIFNSLVSREIILDTLKVTGVHLTLRQQKSGEVSIDGFAVTDNLTGQSLDPNVVLAWIFSQPKLIIQNFDIHYIALDGLEKSIILKWLILSNSDKNHQLSGKAMLNQKMPTQITARFNWEGNVTPLTDVSSAQGYLYLESVSLPEWFATRSWRNLSFKQGVGNAKIWLNWSHGQWQKIHSTLQFYNVQAISHTTQKTVKISRLNGNASWERQGDTYVISGDHLLIDLPNHLWPMNAFTVKLSNQFVLQNFALDYIDLADASGFLVASGLLPKEIEKNILSLNPKGEVRELHGHHVNSALTDITGSAKFSGLTLNAWKNFPAVTNLQGALQWNGQQGEFTLDSERASIAFNEIFFAPLTFDQLHVFATVQKHAADSWLLSAKNSQLMNQDLNARADVSIIFPEQGSPEINLTADFAMAHADQVNNYLPLKFFEPNLVTWLQNAFSGGEIQKGQALVQGRLSDFPFSQGNGKFIISGFVKNMDLNYAPHWPMLRNLNAKLVFSGKGMSVDVMSGQVLDIPLQAVHGEIPDLANSVLTVGSQVKTDIAQGLQFVKQSPLQHTIGKHLSALTLQGPMQLNLRLVVPLGNPDDAQVIGDSTISNITLNLPAWNLALTELNGAFHFTENTITANNLSGKLLGYPVTLELATEQGKKDVSSVLATLQGTVDTQQLGTWLNLPIEDLLQGTTAYQAKLYLPSQPLPTRVVLDSNLRGIRVNLPGNYAKSAQDALDFQLLLEAEEDEPLKAKVNYNKLFSLALVLEKEQQRFSLVSANLNLGKKEADWQTQAGIVITGDIDYLDWNKIQPYVTQFKQKKSTAIMRAKNEFINPDMFRSLDIQTNVLDFSGFKLKNLRIQLTRTANNFVLGLNNANMNGQIIFARAGLQQGVDAKFDRLVIPEDMPSGKNVIDPRDLPAISFVGNNVRYGEMQLGRAIIELVPAAGGLAIKQFDLQSAAYQFQAKGMWANVSSRLQGSVTTLNLNELLTAWGFPSPNLIGSTGSADFNLNWSGGLLSSLRAVSGTVSLKLGEGRIINLGEATDAKIGFGRLLNILSLQSLPRRLSLHFNDLFEKGYSFDYVKGDFTLRSGNAITQNTRINGPIAGIAIAGRIGLAAKDLDLKLGVTPYVTASLPVVAAIATANPVAGVATWVVDKVVSSAMSNMTTYNYSIQGPWANPVWDQIGAQKK